MVGSANAGVSVEPTAMATAVALGLVHRRAVQSQVAAPRFTVKAEY